MTHKEASGIRINLKYNETVLLPNTMFRSRYDLFTIEAEKFLVNILETFILLQLKKNDWQLFVFLKFLGILPPYF